jgi:hypothetical protein
LGYFIAFQIIISPPAIIIEVFYCGTSVTTVFQQRFIIINQGQSVRVNRVISAPATVLILRCSKLFVLATSVDKGGKKCNLLRHFGLRLMQ